MTTSIFVILFTFLAVVVSLITEAFKKVLDEAEIKYSSNVIVLAISLVVGVMGTTVAYVFLSIPFTAVNIICILLMAVAVWVGAMVGYDKVLQLIEQIKTIQHK